MASSVEKGRAHFTYIWKIEHIPRYAVHRSPVFTVQSMAKTKWVLTVLTRFNGGADLHFGRAEDEDGPESIEVEFELLIFDIKGFKLGKIEDVKDFGRKESQNSPLTYDISKLDELFDRSGKSLFTKDPLTVRCCLWRKGTEISKFEMCFATTRFDVYHPSCVWAIRNFSSLQKGEKRIRVLDSTPTGCPKLILTLSVAEQNGEECLFIHLEARESKICFQVDAEIAALDAEGMDFYCERAFTHIIKNNEFIKLSVIAKSDLMAVLLSDDVLVLRCELKLTSSAPVCRKIEDYKLMDYSDSERVETKNSEKRFDDLRDCPFRNIVNKFKEDGTLSDVCLQAGNKSFPVHKLILSSRSSVFRAMFTKDMREKTSKCIDILDMDADTLNRLLLYIYENKIQDFTWSDAVNLFEAADKYELFDLKEKCSCFLKSNISESNVCESLVLADMHYDESLKNSVQEFLLNNLEIMHSDAWKSLRDNHSKLAWETAEKIICNLKNSTS